MESSDTRLRSLDESRQHRNDSFQVGFATEVGLQFDGVANAQYVVHRSTFQCRTACYLKESVLVFQTLLTISLRDVQWYRLGSTYPLIASWSMNAGEILSDRIGKSNLVNRYAINVESVVVKNGFRHHSLSIEYEYEYRFTEYEYDLPDEL